MGQRKSCLLVYLKKTFLKEIVTLFLRNFISYKLAQSMATPIHCFLIQQTAFLSPTYFLIFNRDGSMTKMIIKIK